MNKIKKFNVSIAGLGTVGSNLIDCLIKNRNLIIQKINTEFRLAFPDLSVEADAANTILQMCGITLSEERLKHEKKS